MTRNTTESSSYDSQDNKNTNYKLYLSIIISLLAISLLLNAFQSFSTYQQNKLAEERAASYKNRIQEAEKLVDQQQEIILGLINDYRDEAYGDNVDRIAEQQLIATEYTLAALQILAIQNSQIIELLANAP